MNDVKSKFQSPLGEVVKETAAAAKNPRLAELNEFQSPLGEVVKETGVVLTFFNVDLTSCFNPLSGKW